MIMRRKGICSVYLFFIVLVSLVTVPARAEAKMQVAASIMPLADFCREIGGDKVEVQLLIPPGASPHTFEPSPGILTGLTKAKVLVYIGGGLEPWIDKFLKALKDQKPAVVAATRGLDLIKEIPKHTKAVDSLERQHRHPEKAEMGQGHPHADGAGNPHIWLDPILAQDICRRIAAAFIHMDPENKGLYEAQLTRYLAKLSELDQTITAATNGFQLRQFVGFHPSFTSFARRYQLEEVGIIEVAPGREPTPRALQNIMNAIQHYGIRVIFSEPQFSPRLAEVLAKEAGVSVLSLDPIGGRPPYGDDYLKLMQYNLETMAKAMQ
jgi:zinc transport system substrate-binding protein